ncbi:exodeoxyribonuclease V subunit beta [Marinospirillum alkaliphilum]|uniref:RecBCD enzyme subunit RecB n=1 Tax=Marinospirillum alkaliphilum DSM 21637 TaxID=1122209 RepID=A0A1K1YQR6_9GAMM|nr:exodeoxyribonuclease V subunit beta [Marinospirillum alkaliphilum]SFX63692.1 DNA helicase/exodeoxyribonuclease V, beta subunit [Marinospirillum alkaliphilum DSM 21637]
MSQPLDLMHFPLHGRSLIEASAGTGKTFTLALLYTRLILGQGEADSAFVRPLTPREILVVTFTDAAAEELRDRIRARLVEAAALFRESAATTPDPALLQLRASYPQEQWPTCAWRLQVAAEGMDEASIATIHSWCNRMLVEHAFDTRGLFDRQLVTDTRELLDSVVEDYWRVHFYPLPEHQARLISDCFSHPGALKDALQDLLKPTCHGLTHQGEILQVDDLQPHLLAAQQLQDQEAAIRQHWCRDWDAIVEHLLALRPALNATKHDSKDEAAFLKLLQQIRDWAEGRGAAPNKLKNFVLDGFVFKKGQEQAVQPFPAFTPLPEATSPPLANLLLAHARQWVLHTFRQRLQRQAEMGFDDLLIQLEQALDPAHAGAHATRLATLLRQAFPVAMIDEFQDTDPIQYRIFDAIYPQQQTDKTSALVLIGDPKQAIYSFRGADIHTYLLARQATDGRHFTLTRNFRSTEAMVAACNALFSHAEHHPRGAFCFRTDEQSHNPMPFVAVAAQGRKEALYLPDGAATAVTLWPFSPEPGEERLGTPAYRKLAAATAASQISSWLLAAREGKAGFGQQGQIEQPLQAADIALLVRTGKEARLLKQELARRGIASVYLSDRDSVFASREAADLLHWLRACAEPTDDRLVRAALGTNTLALPLQQLADWQQDELDWERQMQRFQRLHQSWQKQGVLVMLRQLMETWQLPARLLAQSQGERQLTNLLHLSEWLQQAASQLDGEQALIRHLAEHLDSRDEQQILRLESDARLVRIITIHKSKGLEYPLVLLPFISGWRELDGNTPQVPWRIQQQLYLEVAGKNACPEAWQQANQERISEDLRLLYVALTRARHALWLGVAPLATGNARKPVIERSALGYLLNGGQPLDSHQAFMAALQALADLHPQIQLTPPPPITDQQLPASDTITLEAARSLTLQRPEAWWIASYSAIRLVDAEDSRGSETGSAPETRLQQKAVEHFHEKPTATASTPSAVMSSPPPDPSQLTADNLMQYFPAGSQWGTFLHQLLEWAAVHQYQQPETGQLLQGFAAAAADHPTRLQVLQQRCELLDIGAYAEPLSQWLQQTLTRQWQLPCFANDAAPAFSLSGLQPHQLAVEMEFLFEAHQVNAARLDRLVCSQTLDAAVRPQASSEQQLNGLLKGFIDLVIEHQGRYYVIDWKSNRLDAGYSPAALREAILHKRYDLQYVLYLLALHRQLKARLPDYDYDRHLGGAIYVFLRGDPAQGDGLFMDRPPKSLIESLDRLFRGESP